MSVNPAWTAILGWSERETTGRSYLDFVYPEDYRTQDEEPANSPTARPRCASRTAIARPTAAFAGFVAGGAQRGHDLRAWPATSRRARARRRLDIAQEAAAPGAEDGGDRPADRRRRPRLQQPAAGDQRQPPAAGTRRRRATSAAERASANAHGRRRRAAPSWPPSCSPSPAASRWSRKVVNIGRFVARHGRHAAPHAGRGDRGRDRDRRRAVEHAGRPGQVENALLNLAINARDAMDGAGRLTIEAGNALLDDSYAAQRCATSRRAST